MKAAVMYHKGELPRYVDFPEPIPENKDELLVKVNAVAIKHLDRGRATGSHYSSDSSQTQGRVIGGDGVFQLADGSRVYALAESGTLAEKAIIHKDRIVPLPDRLDDVTASAIPNAVAGSAMALRFKADIQPGDTVLVNGATGFTGRVAVQIAKHYGAGKIIVTGRNLRSLEELRFLGADECISLQECEEEIKSKLARIHRETPIDIVIDYIWGRSAELILGTLKGNGGFTNRIRFVSIGAMSGESIQLSAANLRSVDLQLSGSGLGAWSRSQVASLFREILPEMFQLAADGKLQVETTHADIRDIGTLWNLEVPAGRRLVVTVTQP